MSRIWSVGDLDHLPRLGLIQEPSPIVPLSALAAAYGLASLHVKRDDLIPALGGGSKPRKLDYLLALPPFDRAATWQSMGGIGSGHLVAVVQAAKAMQRGLIAHCFDQPRDPHVEDNLGLIAEGATQLRWYRSRLALLLGQPRLVWGRTDPAAPVIAAGATTPAGMVGFVRAGLELAEQVRAGALPEPDVIYLPMGTGGTAAGLSVGLAMAGLRTRICAVAAVERVFANRVRLRRLQGQILNWLDGQGLAGVRAVVPAPIVIDISQTGPGYGRATPAAAQACAQLAAHGLALEAVYTGKAMAAMHQDAPHLAGRHVLFWHTARGQQLAPAADWRRHLPVALARRLKTPAGPGSLTRRRFLALTALAAGGTYLGWSRLFGYPALAGWQGTVLSAREAQILAAAAAAVLPHGESGPAPLTVALHVDHYLAAISDTGREQVHLLLLFIEQGTPLGLHLRRFTSLSPEAREAFLATLGAGGTLPAQAYRGVRDLCLLGYYQDPRTWGRIGYGGPWVAGGDPGAVQFTGPYAALCAAPGARP